MTTPEIARLNPFDGLFLRAVHLQQIQLYTQALTRALGLAGDPGVVSGYGLRTTSTAPGEPPTKLAVQPGLAVDADGRILLSSSTLEVDLPGPGQTLVWRVELFERDEPFGPENSYGDVCVDPCEAPAGTTAFIGEAVGVRLAPLPLPAGLDPTSAAFRNRVASWYFEQERSAGNPVIAASDRDSAADRGRPITTADWAVPTGPATGPLGIGLLLRDGDGFVPDVWAARRDRVQSPPESGWMNRLAMRPWQVFVAQLLQFQDQLNAVWPGAGATPAPGAPMAPSVRADVSDQLTQALRLMRARKSREPAGLLRNALAVLQGRVADVPMLGLADLGFEDLPPAGYLPAQGDYARERLRALFPPETEMVFNTYRADVVVGLVAREQHGDRIPLTRAGGGLWPPRIEIMVPVPDPYAQEESPRSSRAWVAFRRAGYIPSYDGDSDGTESPAPGATDTGDDPPGNGD
ncbi:hypothetical protein SRB5_47760 [Streptomyces sp. RB5]|uniref:Uncharacterized protein n=1 Tax=Streptomyces smaragdinus TaxID=2585196 RepID=A0A7K0CM94_9ACTN|nr:hypothetical protein [Streptomyces smaragdinus]MQY14608.1 hypothetical protein [Streptomyces smaragdinus]